MSEIVQLVHIQPERIVVDDVVWVVFYGMFSIFAVPIIPDEKP
jgi:hypothetical protein